MLTWLGRCRIAGSRCTLRTWLLRLRRLILHLWLLLLLSLLVTLHIGAHLTRVLHLLRVGWLAWHTSAEAIRLRLRLRSSRSLWHHGSLLIGPAHLLLLLLLNARLHGSLRLL